MEEDYGEEVNSEGGRKTKMLEFIRFYQTVVVGVVGFLGVIISIIANGYFSRAQDDRKERREADALKIALIEELNSRSRQ